VTYEQLIARRYLQSKQRAGFISVITFVAVGGVILGVAALVIILSVTNGFSGELKSRLIGMNAHVNIERYFGKPIENWQEIVNGLRQRPDRLVAAPVIEGKVVMATEDEEMDGIFVWGIEQESFDDVSDLAEHLRYDSEGIFRFEPPAGHDRPGIVLGSYLAGRMRVGLQDEIYLM
ncbi:uncharacterized protein METZ01_LOCUS511154, partial [marine metagenome]